MLNSRAHLLLDLNDQMMNDESVESKIFRQGHRKGKKSFLFLCPYSSSPHLFDLFYAIVALSNALVNARSQSECVVNPSSVRRSSIID